MDTWYFIWFDSFMTNHILQLRTYHRFVWHNRTAFGYSHLCSGYNPGERHGSKRSRSPTPSVLIASIKVVKLQPRFVHRLRSLVNNNVYFRVLCMYCFIVYSIVIFLHKALSTLLHMQETNCFENISETKGRILLLGV